MPRQSSATAIVFAVKWPAHVPGAGAGDELERVELAARDQPALLRADRLPDVLDRHVAAAPARIGPL